MVLMNANNTCIACLRKPAGPAANTLASVAPAAVTLTTVTVAELYRGAHLSTKVAENLV